MKWNSSPIMQTNSKKFVRMVIQTGLEVDMLKLIDVSIDTIYIYIILYGLTANPLSISAPETNVIINLFSKGKQK